MGRYFISYRREDTPGEAGRLADHLRTRVGQDQVFIDVDDIRAGEDFPSVIERELAECEAAFVLIGPAWLTSVDAAGRRRLEDPDDFVRLEVEAALRRDVRVVPVLVRNATMPKAEALPSEMRRLSVRQAFALSSSHFLGDIDRLLDSIGGDFDSRRQTGMYGALFGACLVLSVALMVGAPWLAERGLRPLFFLLAMVPMSGASAVFLSRTLKAAGARRASRRSFALIRLAAPLTMLALLLTAAFHGYRVMNERDVKVPAKDVVLAELTETRTAVENSVATGTVLGENSQPLPGAVIDVEHGLATAATNDMGEFRLVVPRAPGTVVPVKVSFKGHVGFRDNLTIPGSFTLRFRQ
jgi:TIR domain